VNRHAGTWKSMREAGISLTRENYLSVESLGNPPAEVEPELLCDEPSFMTRKGYPICVCGKSTRSKTALVCRDCRDGFILSGSDRKVLKAMGIKK
jgi:hypothetical protein